MNHGNTQVARRIDQTRYPQEVVLHLHVQTFNNIHARIGETGSFKITSDIPKIIRDFFKK